MLMATNRSIAATTAGFQIVEREIPAPDAGQVRIKVQACGVYHSDAIIVEGLAARNSLSPGKGCRSICPHDEWQGRVSRCANDVTFANSAIEKPCNQAVRQLRKSAKPKTIQRRNEIEHENTDGYHIPRPTG